MKPLPIYRIALLAITCTTFSHTAAAHMPWLATDDQGHAVMWFGESPADRTYPMPEKVAAIELTTAKLAVDTQPVETDSLRGIRSQAPVNSADEVSGVVTYGLYHGTKLTYHVEHLPQTDSSLWPSQPRPDAPLQSIIAALPSGGASVTILRDGKPAKDVEVKLYCEEGHEEASAKTDIAGIVTFKKSAVEPGLNAIVVGLTDDDAKGLLDGVAYTSTTDYLTATFRIASDKAKSSGEATPKPESKRNSNLPKLDTNSGVSIVPTNLPELPEPLTSFGAAIADGKVYIYGGHTGSAHSYSIDEQSNRGWCLDTTKGENGSWQPLPSGPALQGLALVAHAGRMIRIGGFTAVNAAGEDHNLQSQDDVAAYDSATNAWTDLPSLPEPRSSLDAAVLGDTVYVFGGWQLSGESDDSQWRKTAWSLDLADASATWQPIATPPLQRRAMSVAAHDGKLFVIGGMNSDGKPTTEVNVYDPSSNSWIAGPSLPGSGMSGFGSASFATGGRLYVSTMDGFVHQLAGDEQSWTTVAKSDPARFFHRMLPTNERELLMIGGANMEIGKFTQIDRIELPQ
ncbi:Kelch repeat-containing protein [Rubripirellula reticaptiva]|uniref:N-acetylneuraminate epimerase n=1 Tax=Rubripirellula reticaptiva TaxID=2528013 RepID=A0A5C6EH63_9BACT|nr:kelch repeat-containing protein [Rubripirellula reticaptiva]TWU47775.1 N-acetylneuraminate epimerase precursor [Rubripirellula reticaptiva]